MARHGLQWTSPAAVEAESPHTSALAPGVSLEWAVHGHHGQKLCSEAQWDWKLSALTWQFSWTELMSLAR